MIEAITTIEDPRLDVYARLTDVQLRSRLEPHKGILIAESAKVIDRALDAGLQAISLLVGSNRLGHEHELIRRFECLFPEAPVLTGSPDELAHITGFELTRGSLAAFHRPLPLDAQILLRTIGQHTEQRISGKKSSHAATTSENGQSAEIKPRNLRVAVLEDITNYTNVGAIFRSAAALGLDAVLLTPGCYDPFYRRAIRVSMGAVFQIPWARIGEDVTEPAAHGNVGRKGGWTRTGIPLLHNAGYSIAAMALSENSVPIDDQRLAAETHLALVLGTEGEGLSPITIRNADYIVRIPMSHGVDSLNVAAASAVAFWQLR